MRRQVALFLPDADGNRPCHGGDKRYRDDPNWKDLILFYEYFLARTVGAGSQPSNGWTALAAKSSQNPPLWNASAT